MRGWILTTAVVKGTKYETEIGPLSEPLMMQYAERWEMAWWPRRYNADGPELTPFNDSPAPRGTGVDYANLPSIRRLLDEYEGVVFLDYDVMCVDQSEDICLTVDDDQPIGSYGGLGLHVLKSSELAKAFIDTMWAMRRVYRSYQWLEQAAALHLLGFDPAYPGDGKPPVYVGPTAWSPFVRDLPSRWQQHPDRPEEPEGRFWHPAGVQPFSRRLEILKGYAERARLSETESNSRGETSER